ncbi:N-acetylmuramoyl-L-alanine amidase [Nanoarchaeota archaeon]
MNKKGETNPLMMAIVLAIGVFLLFAAGSLAQRFGKAEHFKITFLIKDSALMIDTLHAVPGDVIFKYNAQNYSGDLRIITTEEHVELYGGQFKFPYRRGVPDIFAEEFTLLGNKSNIIDFVKSGSSIEFGEDIEYKEQERCPTISTKDDLWKGRKLVLDPQFGGRETGDTVNGVTESDLARRIALALSTRLSGVHVVPTRALNQDEYKTDKERLEVAEDADMIISIGIGPAFKDVNPLVIYTSDSAKSRKLACFVLNKLKDAGFDSPNILSSDNALLKDEIPSISIELGKIDKGIENKITEYSEGIYQAIKKYYE